MPRMQLTLILTLGDQIHSVQSEHDAGYLLESPTLNAVSLALIGPTNDLRRRLAVRVNDKRNGGKQGKVNPYGLGDK